MIWLGFGTTLLVWVAFGDRRKWHIDWITAICGAGVAAGAALCLGLYDDVAVALILVSACGAALALRHLWSARTQLLRGAATVIGAAAICFARFGPAEGLF